MGHSVDRRTTLATHDDGVTAHVDRDTQNCRTFMRATFALRERTKDKEFDDGDSGNWE